MFRKKNVYFQLKIQYKIFFFIYHILLHLKQFYKIKYGICPSFKIKVLKYLKPDCLWRFSFRSKIFHLFTDSPFPMNGRPKMKQFTLEAHKVPNFETTKQRRFKISSIYHPQTGWLLLHDPLILKCLFYYMIHSC